MATCRVSRIEVQILRTLIGIQIGQHQNAWVGKRIDYPLPHKRVPQSAAVVSDSMSLCTQTANQPGAIVHDICQEARIHRLIYPLGDEIQPNRVHQADVPTVHIDQALSL